MIGDRKEKQGRKKQRYAEGTKDEPQKYSTILPQIKTMSNRDPPRQDNQKSAPRGGPRAATKRSSMAIAKRYGMDSGSALPRSFATPGYQSSSAVALQPLNKVISQGESSSYARARDEMQQIK